MLCERAPLAIFCEMSHAKLSQIIRYKGGSICSDEGIIEKGDVWVRAGKVIDPLSLFYEEKKAPDLVIDCKDLIVAPGFIDIQINGRCN